MIEVITATFEDGVLKPHERLNLPAHYRVRLVVQPLDEETGKRVSGRGKPLRISGVARRWIRAASG